MKLNGSIEVADEAIAEFCKKWRITEFALFGSVLRDDFGPESDVDVLVKFEADAPWTLFDMVRMEDELSRVLDRRVDLISKRAVENSENWIRRKAILNAARTIYAR